MKTVSSWAVWYPRNLNFVGVQATRLLGGWHIRMAIPRVFGFGVMWYK